MNIQQLEYLIAVDKYKHFGKAAQSCFITQPTLSAMIQKFEDELDVKIFDRTTHPIRTTDVGAEIIVHAKSIIESINELRNKANLLNNILGGKNKSGNYSHGFDLYFTHRNFRFFTKKSNNRDECKRNVN